MNWLQKSLNRQSAVGTAAGLLISSLFFLVLFMGMYRGQLEQEHASAAAQVSRALQTSLEEALAKGDSTAVQAIVDRLAQEPGIHRVMISEGDGRVVLASDASELDRVIPSKLTGQKETTMDLIEESGTPLLRNRTRIPAQDQCDDCAETRSPATADRILYVDFDAAPIQEKARATTLLLMGSGSIIVLINILGGWWFILVFVIRPVEHLTDVSWRLAQGDLDARSQLKGHNELSILGNRFNQMAENLKEKIRELEDKETFMQALVDAIPDGIRVIDENYQVLLSNATYRRQLGIEPEAEAPDLCYAATQGRDSPCPETLMLCPLSEITANHKPLRLVHRQRRLNGESLEVEIYAAPMSVMGKDGPSLMVVESIRDLEQQVRFSHEQRLSELGRLAAGVGHEIHNPLAAVRMALHAAVQSNEGPEPGRDQVASCLDLVDREVEKCVKVTERLLKLSMPPPNGQELVSVDELLDDTLKLVHWEAESQGVNLMLSMVGTPLRVLATDSDIRMVALNLTQNACHAMPQGGQLRIQGVRQDGEIRICFEDTGVGIDPLDYQRIFEPFFSRRADGVQGTGLGLSITKTIVESHGGSIHVESTQGEGSRITVVFPDADVHPSDSSPVPSCEAEV